MGRAVLGAALCVWGGASPAAADLAAEMADLLRSRDCRMPVEALAQVFATMGRRADEVVASLDQLGEAGEATVAAGQVVLSVDACAGPGRPAVPEAVPWIEVRLAAEEGCRLARADVETEAATAGLRAERLGSALGDLIALGRVRSDGEALSLRGDLCGAAGERDWRLDRVLGLGRDSYRAVIGFLALETGCRVDTTDPAALQARLGEVAQRQLGLGADLSAEAEAALRLKVERALADPGPAYRIEPDAIVARYCLP